MHKLCAELTRSAPTVQEAADALISAAKKVYFEQWGLQLPGDDTTVLVVELNPSGMPPPLKPAGGGCCAVQTQVAAWLPLLHVMEIRDPWQLHDGTDIDEDPILMWAEVRCIGRVMLQGDGHVVTLRSSSDENVQTTLVAPYGDSALNATQRSAADALILEAEKLRRACFERETLLRLRQHGERRRPRRFDARAARSPQGDGGWPVAAQPRKTPPRRADDDRRRAARATESESVCMKKNAAEKKSRTPLGSSRFQ